MSWWSRVRQHFGFGGGGYPKGTRQTTYYGDISKYKRGQVVRPKHYTYQRPRYRDAFIPPIKQPRRVGAEPEGAPKDNLDYLRHFGVQPETIQKYRGWLEKQMAVSPEAKAEMGEQWKGYEAMPWWKKLYTAPPGVSAEPIGISGAGSFGALSHLGKMGKVTKIGKIINIDKIVNVASRSSTGKWAVANTKQMGLSMKILKKVFSPKALAFYGAWAASVTIGLWATAEAPESIAFPETKFLISEAQRTGDWSIVDEAEAAKDEILDMKTWEKIALWSPVSFLLISKKIQGAIKGAEVMKRIIEDSKTKQELGLSESQMWDDINKRRIADEKAMTDYYNEQRIITEGTMQDIRRIAQEERDAKVREIFLEELKLWEKHKKRMIELEREQAEAQAEFWLEYKKKTLEMEEEARERNIKLWEEQAPSQLGFGLLR